MTFTKRDITYWAPALWGDGKTQSVPPGVCWVGTEATSVLTGAKGGKKRECHADTGLTTCFTHTRSSNPMDINFYK